MAYTYRICMVYDHVYNMLLVQGNPAIYTMPAKYIYTTQQLWVLNNIFNSGHPENSQPFIEDCMFLSL